MRAAFALRIFSGKMIFRFGTAERLRALRCPVFTGRGLHGKRQLPRLLPAQRSVLPACGKQKSAPRSAVPPG